MSTPDSEPVFQLAHTDRCVGAGQKCLIVAEIGQNHQGDIKIAKQLIIQAQRCGADVVKFQKTSLPDKFTAEVLAKPYSGPHSWGDTYGAHKTKLEFSQSQHRQLQQFATEVGVLYAASAMDPVSAEFLSSCPVPFIKIGSGDADNLPMIASLAKKGIPLFISTGMQDEELVRRVYDTVTKHNCPLVLLQCTSAYPTPDDQINLSVLARYRQLFPRAVIGYSGHEQGVAVSVSAVALGAKVLERHITLNHEWRGSDHSSSLQPEQLLQLVSEMRRVETAIGTCSIKQLQPCELPCRRKLSKSVVASHWLPVGHQLQPSTDLRVKVAQLPEEHLHWPPIDIERLEGRRLAAELQADQAVSEHVLVPEEQKEEREELKG